jgi:hypothetical protein
VFGITNRTVKSRVRKDKKQKFYNVMAVPALSGRDKNWVQKNKKKKKKAAYMKNYKVLMTGTTFGIIKDQGTEYLFSKWNNA